MQHSARHALRVVLATLVAACGGSSSSPPPSASPAGWWTDRVFYEVFVRSFADSDGDGIGDLRGLVSKLDDLNDGNPATTTDLGVDALWLMPIFRAASYHGYDVTDYREVDPAYGTLADVEALVSTAHARGVRVVLDLAINHTSDQHPWFVDSAAGSAAKRDWYLWRGSDPGWTQGGAPVWHPRSGAYYYGYFWGGMPDLNLGNPAVEAELLEVMRFWLSRGVDGFRLDGVRHYFESAAGDLADQPATHAFVKRLRSALAPQYPHLLLVADTWTTPEIAATYWGGGDEAQLAFFHQTGMDGLRKAAFFGDATYLVDEVRRAESAVAGKDRGLQAPFLSDHDHGRALLEAADVRELRVGTAALMALPGTPFLYYGDEIGMKGGYSDPAKRTPFRWSATPPGYGFTTASKTWYENASTVDPLGFPAVVESPGVDVATQRADAGSMWHLHRRLVAVRRAHPALGHGDVSFPAVTGGGAGALAILRATSGERVLFVVNFAGAPTGPFTVAASGTPAVLDAEGLGTPPTPAGGTLSFAGLAARSYAFLSLQ